MLFEPWTWRIYTWQQQANNSRECECISFWEQNQTRQLLQCSAHLDWGDDVAAAALLILQQTINATHTYYGNRKVSQWKMYIAGSWLMTKRKHKKIGSIRLCEIMNTPMTTLIICSHKHSQYLLHSNNTSNNVLFC
jgi:hypothetical protein